MNAIEAREITEKNKAIPKIENIENSILRTAEKGLSSISMSDCMYTDDIYNHFRNAGFTMEIKMERATPFSRKESWLYISW